MRLYFQRPNTGSRWFFGNFSLGIMVDSHPRFVNVIFAFLVVEMVIAWRRQNAEVSDAPDSAAPNRKPTL